MLRKTTWCVAGFDCWRASWTYPGCCKHEGATKGAAALWRWKAWLQPLHIWRQDGARRWKLASLLPLPQLWKVALHHCLSRFGLNKAWYQISWKNWEHCSDLILFLLVPAACHLQVCNLYCSFIGSIYERRATFFNNFKFSNKVR